MFYKIVNRVYVEDNVKESPAFFAELYQDEMAVVYYRTLLQSQIALDIAEEQNDNFSLHIHNIKSVIQPMKKEEYIKTLLCNSQQTIIYAPSRRKYSELFGKVLMYNMITYWPEYLEDAYV